MAIHHLQIWVPDLGRAERSWGWLLGHLGYTLVRSWEHGHVWHMDGTSIVIEASPDMVPGMLYSRWRPGLNHIAFRVEGTDALAALVAAAPGHGWTQLGSAERHPLPPGTTIAYLEDGDGFEVELLVPES